MRTAEQSRLEAAHRAAVCDTLCGFLEQGCKSPVDDLRSLCLSTSLLKRALNMYMTRSGDTQAKPMRQVLTVLVKLLSMIPDRDRANLIANETVHRCLSVIYSHEDLLCIRGAINILDFFLGRCLITTSLLLEMASDLSADSQPADGLRASSTQVYKHSAKDKLSTVRSVPAFVSVILSWLQEADVAPAAGRLVVSVFTGLTDGMDFADSGLASPSAVSLWLPPILEALRVQPELIENLEHHVLPGLIRLDPTYIDHIVSALPVESSAAGAIGSVSEEELRLCLVVCKLADDLGINLSLGRSQRLHEPTFAAVAN